MMIPEIANLDEPFQVWSCSLAIANQQNIINQLNKPFEALNVASKNWKKLFSDKSTWLAKTDNALTALKKSLEPITGIAGIYLNFREVHNRVPSDLITEICVVIPESNRELENRIYETFRILLATNDSLLFEPHIAKLRGHEIIEVIPESFWSI